MSAPFQPGDCVVCVDASPYHVPDMDRATYLAACAKLRRGSLYRVLSCPWRDDWGDGPGAVVEIDGPNPPRSLWRPELPIGWSTERFRKIENDTGFDFREQIRAKPVRPVLNPSRHPREMV